MTTSEIATLVEAMFQLWSTLRRDHTTRSALLRDAWDDLAQATAMLVGYGDKLDADDEQASARRLERAAMRLLAVAAEVRHGRRAA